MGYLVFTVFVDHVSQNIFAPVFIKININIGHGDPVRVQETFKQQIIFDGIDICDPVAVGYH